jgi:hypothetical protein
VPALIIGAWLYVSGGLFAVAAAHPRAGIPIPILTDGQLLCGGEVFSIYAFTDGLGAGQFLVNLLSDEDTTPDFLLGPDQLEPELQSMVTLLANAQQKGTRVLVSFVPVPGNPPRLTGVFEPSAHFVPVTRENCPASNTPIGAKWPVTVPMTPVKPAPPHP